MLDEAKKQRAIDRILTFESSVSKAFVRRRCDGIFAKVGYMASEKMIDDPLQAIWLGWETLIGYVPSDHAKERKWVAKQGQRDIIESDMSHYTG